MKNTRSVNLTINEMSVIWKALRATEECMEYEDYMECYTDGGRFLLSLDEDELKALRSAIKKF